MVREARSAGASEESVIVATAVGVSKVKPSVQGLIGRPQLEWKKVNSSPSKA